MALKLKPISIKIKLRVKAKLHILMVHSMKAPFLLDKETAMGCISPNSRSMRENGNPTASKAKVVMKSFLEVNYIKALFKTTNFKDKALLSHTITSTLESGMKEKSRAMAQKLNFGEESMTKTCNKKLNMTKTKTMTVTIMKVIL
jgi:hypothetical protein